MSQGGLEHRALKVASVTGLSMVINIGLQILTVPVCLKYWGASSYGSWLALLSVFSMLQLTCGGYVNYVGNKMNLLYHQSEEALQKTLASALVGVAILGGLLLAVVVGMMAFGVMPDLMGGGDPSTETDLLNLAMLTLTMSWLLGGFYLGIVHRLLVPAGFMYQAAWWSLGAQLSLALVIMLTAFVDGNIFQASFAYMGMNILFVYASAWYVRNKLPQYFPWWRGVSLTQGARDLLYSTPQIFSGLIKQGATNGLVLLVSSMAGAAAVPVFTTVRTLSNLWANVTTVLTAPLLPEVVRFHAKKEHDKLLTVQQVHSVLVGGGVNLSILLAFPFIAPLFAFWTRQTLALDRPLLCALLASVSLLNLGAMMNAFLDGVNHHRAILLTTLSRGGISFGAGAVLMRSFGISGLGMAVWIGELVSLCLIFYYFFRLSGQTSGLVQNARQLAPSLLGVGSLMIFLGLQAISIATVWVYGICIVGVCVSIYWGWIDLAADVRSRLFGLIAHKFIGKAA